MRASFERFLREFGPVEKPHLVWQDFLDTDVKAVERLCGLSSESPRVGDLNEYVSHLQYVPIEQPELIVYLLPLCLEAWHSAVMCKAIGRGFAQHFDAALCRHDVLRTLLTPLQCAAVSRFIGDTMLDRLMKEDDLHDPQRYGCSWLPLLADCGTFMPDIAELWNTWWALEYPGHGVAALQYVSCLIQHNEQGSALWEYEQFNARACWLPDNVAFLARTLNVAYLQERTILAVRHLKDTDKLKDAKRIQNDLEAWSWLIEARCQELPRFLEQPATSYYEWSL